MKKIILVLVIYLPLTACMVGPDFIGTEAPQDQHYLAEGDPVYTSIAPNWWQDLQAPQLNALIELGLANNYDLQAAQENLEQAREQVLAQTGQLWPQLSFNANAGRQKYGVALFGPSNFKIPPFTYYEFGPSVNLFLDVFGGTRRTIEKQQALMVYQNEEFIAAKLAVTGGIVATALNIAAIDEEIDTSEKIIADDEKNLSLVQQALHLGSGTKTDVVSAKTQLENDQTLLPPLHQQLSLAKSALGIYVGKAPASWQVPEFELKDFVLPKKLPLIIPSELVRQRPDILAAEAMLHAASAEVGVATAHLYPSINISATTLQEALTPNQLFNSSANAWSLLGGISAPIFNGGSLRAERRAAIHAYQAAYAHYQQVVIKAFSQVSDILNAIKHDKEAVKTHKRALLTAKESLRLARLSYNAGNVGSLQVLDAERLYTQARLGYVRAKAKRYQDTVQLYLVLGGGRGY